jgi:hypothetical protein
MEGVGWEGRGAVCHIRIGVVRAEVVGDDPWRLSIDVHRVVLAGESINRKGELNNGKGLVGRGKEIF